MAHGSYSLSLSKILSFLICAFRSCIYIFLLSIRNSAIHPNSCMLFGSRCPVAIFEPYAGVEMLSVGTARYFCVVAAGRGTFACDGAPDRIVSCAGDARLISFACPWGS